MKTLLYMAMSANGCVADHKDRTPWSDGGWIKFRKAVKASGNLVIGRRTFEIMNEGGDFARVGNPFVVVVSRTLKLKSSKKRSVARAPRQALKILKDAGYSRAMVAGGAKLNGGFIEQNLVDEITLDVEPFLFGKGLPLFQSRPLMRKLKLITAKKYPGGFSLHYKILM